MNFGLGIDTGGTYTDAVIFDFDAQQVVCTAKAITIKEDLQIGIDQAIEKMPAEAVGQVRLVSLSTTLATNACVEGKGSRAKLIMIGCYQKIVSRYGHEYGLPAASEIIFLDGGHDQKGEIIGEPDWIDLKAKVEACRNRVDAFAVVQLWGIRNTAFEKKAKDLLQEWTGLPVVCGFELTGELNSMKRAASALLNAQLLPVIEDFLNAIKRSLKHFGIKAPLVIVRGDGSLMTEEFSRGKPVETLLCGPAASVAGGIYLSGEKNCIIVDMGGTTSDLAIVRNGIPRYAAEGAQVGKWRTGIRSIQINTVGLGGDSLIRHDSHGLLTVGPVRAAPLSWTASRWPEVLEKIKIIDSEKRIHTVSLCEFFYLIRDISRDPFYHEEETGIARALQEGPLSISELANALHTSVYELKTRRLEQHGIIMRCGLTPTDIMHLTGDFTGWSLEAASRGAMIMANQIDRSLDELIRMVHEKLLESLHGTLVKTLLADDDEDLLKDGMTRQLEQLLSSSFRKKRQARKNSSPDFFECGCKTSATLVGIGAPIHIYLPDIARVLQAKYVIPGHAEVANAIGAITGNVVAEESVLIKPQYSTTGITGYIAFTASGNQAFARYQDSVDWAKTQAEGMARTSAMNRGADTVELSLAVLDNEFDLSRASEEANNNQLLLETIVTAKAVGKIKWVSPAAF